MNFEVIKRMAKGSVEPLTWVAVFFAAVFGTTYLIANIVQADPKAIYMYVWASYAVGVLLYWAYSYTKWNMEWEQRWEERDRKFKEEMGQ
jgi:hypothetical protein